MKAAFVKPGADLEVSECPTPEPGRGEVVVKIAYCGICGSDIHLLEAGVLPAGSIIGHEQSGHVETIGDGVEDWNEGDPAVVIPYNPCLSCEPCRNGHVQLCNDAGKRSYGLGANPGGFGQYMLVKSSMLFRVPEGLDMKTAALTEPWAVAVHGVNMLDSKIGSVGLIMGAGPIGLLCIYALKMAGAAGIYVSEPDKYRADKAEAAGADAVIDPTANDPGIAIRQMAGRAPDYVIDCAGTESSTQSAASIVGTRGQVLVLGVHLGSANLIPPVCIMKEVQLNFGFGYNFREFADSLKLLARGAVDPEIIISDVIPLGEIDGAFKSLKETGHSKILIDCQDV